MQKKKVSVGDLVPGMYVAELDRPWTETGFVFQGFYIQGEGEIKALAKTCRYVFIDVERGYDPDAEGWSQVREEPDEKPVLESGGPKELVPEEPDFRKGVRRVREYRRSTAAFLDNAMSQVRSGKGIPTNAAATAVNGLIKSIRINVNASIWLNNLKRRHEHSADHCANVAVVSLAFAYHLGYRGRDLASIGLGALLHDVGLMRLPSELLDKPADLEIPELQEIREHPLEGYRMMKRNGNVPEIALNIIRYHHERVSGDGYPEGLSGDQIPTEALIVSIADVYDAMTTDRPYRNPLSPHGCLSVIRHMGATDFGAKLAREFMTCIGVYPISSVVELNNGSIAMVVAHNHRTRVRPEIMLLWDRNGKPYEDWPIMSIDRKAEQPDGDQWLIMRVVDPEEYNVDVGKVTEEYLDRNYLTTA